MKSLTTAAAFALLFVCQALASEHSALARVTVYWHREGSGEHSSWNGAQLREKHCAVDPKKIPYGSEVVFPDATCVAVDSGPGVVNRKAARSCGRTAAERNAIVIDRFFDTKQKALAWAKGHPHFMTVRILTPGTEKRSKLVATKNPGSSPTNIVSCVMTSWRGRANDFYQRFESSLDVAALTVAESNFAICQEQNIGAYVVMFATDYALLAAALSLFYSAIIRQIKL
jgi:3D (Asp-Asp-Asp) domain-containing protein